MFLQVKRAKEQIYHFLNLEKQKTKQEIIPKLHHTVGRLYKLAFRCLSKLT